MKAYEFLNVCDRITVINNYDVRCDSYIKKTDHVVVLGTGSGEFNKTYERIKHLSNLVDKPPVYVCSFTDMYFVDQNSLDSNSWDLVSWYQSQYITATFQFTNNNRYVMTTGGIKPTWNNWNRFRTNLEQTTVHAGFFGKNWYDNYDGRFGFVISNSYMPEHTAPKHALSLYIEHPEYQSNICHIGPREHNIIKLPISQT